MTELSAPTSTTKLTTSGLTPHRGHPGQQADNQAREHHKRWSRDPQPVGERRTDRTQRDQGQNDLDAAHAGFPCLTASRNDADQTSRRAS